jgi:signal transduction histidine kinase
MSSSTRYAAPVTRFARRPRFARTASFRLTLFHAGLFAVAGLLLFGMIYWAATDFAAQDEAKELELEIALVEDEMTLLGENRLAEIIDTHLERRRDVRAIYLLQDAQGRKVTGNIDARTPVLGPTMVPVDFDGEVRNVRAHGHVLANGQYVLLGQDAHILREMEETLLQSFGAGLVFVLLAMILGGGYIGARYVARVGAISRTARAIVSGNMTSRALVTGRGDEFDDLAMSLNAMLDRIDELMRSMRQISNDVAHDLRTPLTRFRQRLELANRHALTVEDYRNTVGVAIADIDSILETFGALLRIAQIEAGEQAMPSAAIDLSALVRTVAEDFAPAAEDRGYVLTTDIENGIMIAGDPRLLTQLLVNLVDNAVRHTPVGTRIALQARLDGDHPVLAVADTGPGIPASEMGNVLKPFYRLETSRTTEGSGLGLNLVAAIAKQHRADLRLSSIAPGLLVEVIFPKGSTPVGIALSALPSQESRHPTAAAVPRG